MARQCTDIKSFLVFRGDFEAFKEPVLLLFAFIQLSKHIILFPMSRSGLESRDDEPSLDEAGPMSLTEAQVFFTTVMNESDERHVKSPMSLAIEKFYAMPELRRSTLALGMTLLHAC